MKIENLIALFKFKLFIVCCLLNFSESKLEEGINNNNKFRSKKQLLKFKNEKNNQEKAKLENFPRFNSLKKKKIIKRR